MNFPAMFKNNTKIKKEYNGLLTLMNTHNDI